MQFSYSRVSTFQQCEHKFKLHYIDEIRTVPDQSADNALILGNALHLGIEKGRQAMLDQYFGSYYIITDEQINEAIKLEILLDKVQAALDGVNVLQHEYTIDTDVFKGIVDLMIDNAESIDVLDFKYSNNVDRYLESGQLHIYRYFLQDQYKLDRLGFMFIPKTAIKQKQEEDLYQFRRRMIREVKSSELHLVPVNYEPEKVADFFKAIIAIQNKLADPHAVYPKNITRLCDWCQFQKYCLEGLDYMILPKNERREVSINTTPDMWLYGDSYSGKTVFMDSFDDMLMINTDGNVDHISSPIVRIMDTFKQEGRLRTKTFAWRNFLDTIDELEKKENDFKGIVVDLVEDLWEHCRLYMYDKLQIDHEHDAGFGKGYDMVRTEFLSNMKRLKNLGYQLVYISKVVTFEVTLKGGSKVTTYRPNINEKIANVLAGTVDLTARVVADGDERYMNFKVNPYIFGGSRYNFGVDQIPLNREEFLRVLTAAQGGRRQRKVEEPGKVSDQTAEETSAETSVETPPEETPKRRGRKVETVLGDTPDDDSGIYTEPDEPATQEEPQEQPRRTRRRAQ